MLLYVPEVKVCVLNCSERYQAMESFWAARQLKF
jgi:hypothetical protein